VGSGGWSNEPFGTRPRVSKEASLGVGERAGVSGWSQGDGRTPSLGFGGGGCGLLLESPSKVFFMFESNFESEGCDTQEMQRTLQLFSPHPRRFPDYLGGVRVRVRVTLTLTPL